MKKFDGMRKYEIGAGLVEYSGILFPATFLGIAFAINYFFGIPFLQIILAEIVLFIVLVILARIIQSLSEGSM